MRSYIRRAEIVKRQMKDVVKLPLIMVGKR